MDGEPRLRPWRATDAEDLLESVRFSGDLERQVGGELADLDAARQHIETVLTDGPSRVVRAVDWHGTVVGTVGLTHIEPRHGTAWVSYWLARRARDRGLATRALSAIAALGFARGVFRLELGHRIDNPQSCSVATRAGFVAEGG